jgi:hypothetical protein
MNTGIGIALGSLAISIAAVLIKWITATNSSNINCAGHSLVVSQVDGIIKWLTRVEEKLDRVIERAIK